MLFRNILSLIAVLTAAGVPAGCSTTARLTRRQATAHLAQLSRTERQSKVRDDRPQVVRVERDSSDYYLVPVERDGQGEALGTVPIEEVVVTGTRNETDVRLLPMTVSVRSPNAGGV